MKLTRYGTRSMLTRRSEARQRRETVRRKADRGDRFGTQIDPTRNEHDRERRAPIPLGSARVFCLDLLLDARADRSLSFFLVRLRVQLGSDCGKDALPQYERLSHG